MGSQNIALESRNIKVSFTVFHPNYDCDNVFQSNKYYLNEHIFNNVIKMCSPSYHDTGYALGYTTTYGCTMWVFQNQRGFFSLSK